MKRFPLFLIGIASVAAEPPGIEQSMEFVAPPIGGMFIRWHGKSGRSYFLQVSDPTDHLKKWKWAPVIEGGNDEDISYEVEGTADKGFFRIKYADQIPESNETLDTADFDGDGISNIDEISPPQMAMAMRGPIPPSVANASDPLNPDTDGDGLPDGWERNHGLNPNDSADASDLFPGSNLTNLQSFNSGVQADPNATPTNKDGDSAEDIVDADPNDGYVDWEPAAEASYAIVELEQESYGVWSPNSVETKVTRKASIGKNGLILYDVAISHKEPDGDQFKYPSSRTTRVWKNGTWSTDLSEQITPLLDSSGNKHSFSDLLVCGDYVVGNVDYHTDTNDYDPKTGGTRWNLETTNGTSTRIYSSDDVGGEGNSVEGFYDPVATSPGGAMALVSGSHFNAEIAKWRAWFPPGGNAAPSYIPGNGASNIEISLDVSMNYSGNTVRAIDDSGSMVVEKSDGTFLSEGGTEVILPADADAAWYHCICKVANGNTGDSRLVVGATKIVPNSSDYENGSTGLWIKNGAEVHAAQRTPTIGRVKAIAKNGMILGKTAIWRNGQSIALNTLVEYQKVSGPTSATRFTNLEGLAMNGDGAIVATADDPLNSGDGHKTLILLLPMEVVSRDKYLAGSFSIPSGWDSLEMEFVGPDGSLGKYGKLLGGGSTKIYDKVEDVMADADYAAGGQADTQKVWFVRDSTDARKINYYTCFDSTGDVQIKLYLNGDTDSIGEITHALTAAEDFAAVIDYVDQWVKGTSFDFTGGVITPPLAMQSASAQSSAGGGIHNLTRAALIPFFNVINNVEGLGNVAFGLFDGVKAGVGDDWKLLLLIKSGVLGAGGWAIESAEEELTKWRDDPLKRAAELKKAADRICQDWVFKPMEQLQADLSTWEGFKKRSWQTWNSVKGTTNKVWVVTKDSWNSITTGFSEWMEDYGARMIEGAEKTHWSEQVMVMDKFQQITNAATITGCYALGYSTGYIAEQVAVGVLTGGTVKIGAVLTKGGVTLAGQIAARRVLPVVARLQFLKKWAASAAISIEMKAAVERGLVIAAESPLSLAVKDSAAEVIERGMARVTFQRMDFSNSKVLDEILKTLYVKKLILSPGREGQLWRRFAIFFEVMDDKATAGASKGWVHAYDRILRFEGDTYTWDWSDDLLALYKAETSPAGRLNLKEAMEDLASVMDQNPSAVFPRIKIPRPSELYDEFYCVKGSATEVGGGNSELILDYVKRERKLPPRSFGSDLSVGPRGHYIGNQAYGSPQETLRAYQIDSTWSDAKVRFTIQKESLDGKSIICYSADKDNLVLSNRLEPKTRDWPIDSVTQDPLPGGATQLLSEEGVVTKIEVWRNGNWEIESFN